MLRLKIALLVFSALGGAAIAAEPQLNVQAQQATDPTPDFKAEQAAAFLRGQVPSISATEDEASDATEDASVDDSELAMSAVEAGAEGNKIAVKRTVCDAERVCQTRIVGFVDRGFQLSRGAMANAGTSRQVPSPKKRVQKVVRKGSPSSGGSGGRAAVIESPAYRAIANGNLMINFDLGSAVLLPQARANVREFAAALNLSDLRSVKVSIEGHTDAVGDSAANKSLSERRAAAVRQYMIQLGVDGDRLFAVGFGEEKLAFPDAPDAPANRRVQAKKIN
jgi:outer membrane protein OmpA-like peptidoglycan-associated protein